MKIGSFIIGTGVYGISFETYCDKIKMEGKDDIPKKDTSNLQKRDD